MRAVERDGEKTSLAPLEALLLTLRILDQRRPGACEDVDHFFVKVSLSPGLAPGRQTSDVHAGDAFHAAHEREIGLGANTLPVPEVGLVQVGETIALVDRDALPARPALVRRGRPAPCARGVTACVCHAQLPSRGAPPGRALRGNIHDSMVLVEYLLARVSPRVDDVPHGPRGIVALLQPA